MAVFASNYETTAAPVSIVSHAGAQIASIQCAQCGGREQWSINGRRPPPEVLPKHFQKKGWATRKRPTCPACTIKNKEAQKMNAKVTPITQQPAPITANTDAARKNKRLVIVALEDYFDEAAKRYRDGKTDNTVAEELNLAPAFVKSVREEFYGKLAEPEDITLMRDALAKLTGDVAAVQKRLADLIQRNGWVA